MPEAAPWNGSTDVPGGTDAPPPMSLTSHGAYRVDRGSNRSRDYDGYRRSSRRGTRTIGIILSGIGLILSGSALLIVVLRQPPPVPVPVITMQRETVPSDPRLASALQQVIREPAVTEQIRKHLIQWVEGEQFRQIQSEMADYITSDVFHQRLVDSIKDMRVQGVPASEITGQTGGP